MLFTGRYDEAISLVKSAIRLNPYYPSWYLQALAMAYSMIGEYEQVIAVYEKILNRRKESGGMLIPALLGLVADSIFLGRENEAKAYMKEVLELALEFSLKQFQKANFLKIHRS